MQSMSLQCRECCHCGQQAEPLAARAEAEEEAGSEGVQRDERRLAELGRLAVEMHVMSHILDKLAVGARCSDRVHQRPRHGAASSALLRDGVEIVQRAVCLLLSPYSSLRTPGRCAQGAVLNTQRTARLCDCGACSFRQLHPCKQCSRMPFIVESSLSELSRHQSLLLAHAQASFSKAESLRRHEALMREAIKSTTERNFGWFARISACNRHLHVIIQWIEHVACKQAAFSEAEALRRQEALIREEERGEADADARAALKAAADRERRARKKLRLKVKVQARIFLVYCETGSLCISSETCAPRP